jgi:hypothetical protein
MPTCKAARVNESMNFDANGKLDGIVLDEIADDAVGIVRPGEGR